MDKTELTDPGVGARRVSGEKVSWEKTLASVPLTCDVCTSRRTHATHAARWSGGLPPPPSMRVQPRSHLIQTFRVCLVCTLGKLPGHLSCL